MRGGGTSRGSALGGGVAYGHQIGNGKWRVPGNSFAYHGDALNRFMATLGPAERAAAILPAPPHELVLQVQGAGAGFPGVAIGSLGEASQDEARRLLETVFSCYPDDRQREAFACIEGNGGLAALHVAVYASHGFYADMQSRGTRSTTPSARSAAVPTGRSGASRAPAPSCTSRALRTCTPTSRWCAIRRARTSANRSRASTRRSRASRCGG